MSSGAVEGRHGPRRPEGAPQAGFMLVEVLVATVIAALMLGVISRALADGWRSTRIPRDVLAAVTAARADLMRGSAEGAAVATPGMTIARRSGFVSIVARPTPVAPAPSPASPVQQGPKGNDVMPGVTEHPEAGGGHSGQLRWMAVTVRTPGGRAVTLETVRLDAAPN